jgi:O-antigen/teichoic acid export membrane protein
MAIGLYTSRAVLATLGADDFGLNAVVTSVVTIFYFLNNSMAGATSRFLTFELGKGDKEKLQKTFSAALTIHIIIAFIILVLGETIGLWYLENKMVIPEGRMMAVRWVYQLSLVSAMIIVTQVPYNATIIANERMNVYAYIEILQTCLRLGIVYLLVVGNLDKLILYAILTLLVTMIISLVYRIYCARHFEECKYKFHWDKQIIYPMLSFSGWDLLATMAFDLKTKGVNIILNLFFPAVINAAYAISMQVNSQVTSLSNNFLLATKPQITKYYSNNRIKEMESLMIHATKFSFLLVFAIVLPIILEIDFVLNIWLKNPPKYVSLFCTLILIMTLLNKLWSGSTLVFHATGKIKLPSLVTGSLYLIIPIVSYIIFKSGNRTPYIPFIISIVIFVIVLFVRLYICYYSVPQLSILRFLKEVLLIGFIVIILSSILPIFICFSLEQGFSRFLLVTLSSLMMVSTTTYYIALSKQMRTRITKMVVNRIKNKSK